ncbi:methyltransferase domain-containing protein [Mycolicibacterium palauense]|uniref:methyltransferase domain-containing protein n=1 Tax=Mycolicibacterium palauense TaxID=2034511 RepID=UPI001FE878A0|nr:class I SAM-dependent methyltransferase [Mycolicibacterium palauense]
MIAAARAQEARRPLGIDYVVADLRVPVPQQDFDLAVAAYVLVYARDRGELAKMCRGLAARVRPGGRFVTLTTNPALYHYGSLPDYSKYGFRIGLSDNVAEGAPIELSVAHEGGALVIENYYLPIEAYESALSDAGFGEIRVHRPELSPAPEGADEGVEEGDFWADYLNKPPTVVIECVRL